MDLLSLRIGHCAMKVQKFDYIHFQCLLYLISKHLFLFHISIDIECPLPPSIPTHTDYKLTEDDGSVFETRTHWPDMDNITQTIWYNMATNITEVSRNFNATLMYDSQVLLDFF